MICNKVNKRKNICGHESTFINICGHTVTFIPKKCCTKNLHKLVQEEWLWGVNQHESVIVFISHLFWCNTYPPLATFVRLSFRLTREGFHANSPPPPPPPLHSNWPPLHFQDFSEFFFIYGCFLLRKPFKKRVFVSFVENRANWPPLFSQKWRWRGGKQLVWNPLICNLLKIVQ